MKARTLSLDRHLRLPITLLALALLQGCAAAPRVLDDWLPERTSAPLRPRLIEIAERDLPTVCSLQGLKVYGCSIRQPEQNVCLIYTGPQPAQWLVDHEKKHCEGWEHSDPRTAAAVIRTDSANPMATMVSAATR